jgi:hypothetical protein
MTNILQESAAGMAVEPKTSVENANDDVNTTTEESVAHEEEQEESKVEHNDDDRSEHDSEKGSDDESEDDSVSVTSTENFEHEPFETFQEKVKDLCQHLYPTRPRDAFTITRMEGGGYNRVIGIEVAAPKPQLSKFNSWLKQVNGRLGMKSSRSSPETSDPEELAIRIPRMEHAWFEHEIATIRFLHTHSTIPAPWIKTFDLSKDNPLGERYTIQPRIPGASVLETDDEDKAVWERLDTAQRISFAQDLGSALEVMGRFPSPCPGTLDPDKLCGQECSHHPIPLFEFQCPNRNAFHPPTGHEMTRSEKPMTVIEFLKTQFARQREYDISCSRVYTDPWKNLWPIVEKLNELGIFEDNNYYLTHMDFEPRNVMVNIIDDRTARLSAILDWDEAVFAPAFVNCKPPSWLWDFEGEVDDELDESKANETPPNPELAEVKRAFEDAAGPTYLRYAYTPEYRIARTICRVAITCIHGNDDYEALEKAVNEWNELYPEWAAKSIWDYDFGDDGAGGSGSESNEDTEEHEGQQVEEFGEQEADGGDVRA